MALSSGTRLGAYEVLALLGSGGMGEVYRAHDTKLGRDVALKIVSAAFSHDPERLARFQREAQLLAALNHPHIGAIYGVNEAEGSHFLVLELVEGETLAERVARGRLPLGDAVAIARQVVDALEAAHEKGIIHRDLKPSNIAINADGQVKVLDFGLAKAMDPAGLPSGTQAAVTHSPTLTFAATQAGVILGTAAYMSPEQAKGRVADKRSDVWAFGCVLFEMLSGVRAFEGEDVSDTMAAVLRGEPAWNALPTETPPAIRTLLKRCLDKDRRTRIPEIAVVRFLLDDATNRAAEPAPASAPGAVPSSARAHAVPWSIALASLALAATAVVLWAPWRGGAVVAPTRMQAQIGADASLITDLGASAVLSPDGRLLALVARKGADARSQLYLRRLDQLQAAPLSGTDDAAMPFFSPDGQWIGFFAGGKLKKIAVTGGAAVTLCDAPNPRGGVWASDGTVVFNATAGAGLSRVSSAGGTPEALTKLGNGESSHRWPDFVPETGAVLYTVGTGTGFAPDGANVMVLPKGGTPKLAIRGAYHARYVATGHLVYLSNGTLFAVPFDAARSEVTGQAVPVQEAVANSAANGGAQFAVSSNGTLVYLAGETLSSNAPVQWMDRSGKPMPLRATPADWSNPAFAPNGQRLAIDISDGTQADVWVYEWARDTLSRLTFDPTDDARPVWTPDSQRIAFASKRGDKTIFNLYWQRADGTGEVQRLTESKYRQLPGSWHPSGRFLAFSEARPQAGEDLMILPIEGDQATGWKPGTPTAFLATPQTESSPMFSPDGRWIAYISNETGRNEIYVRPFPGPGGKWQISNGTSDDPTWSRARRELFFASATDLRLMVAPYTVVGESFQAEKPQVWSEGRLIARPRPPSRDLDLHPDGARFALSMASDAAPAARQDRVFFVFNFFDEVRRVTGSGR